MLKNTHPKEQSKDAQITALYNKIKLLSVTLFFTIILATATTTFYVQAQHDVEQGALQARQYNAQLIEANNYLVTDLAKCRSQLSLYQADEAYLKSIGASENIARITIKAAYVHHKGLSPKN